MPKYISKLTKKQKDQMKPWAEKWIKIGLQTGKTDWKTFDKYMPICFQKAGLEYPKRVVRVSSPFVGAFAASIAEKILKTRRGGKDGVVDGAVGGAVRDAVDDAIGGAIDGAVRDAVGGAVGGAVRDAVRGVVDGVVRDAVRGVVDGVVRGVVDGVVRGAVGGAVRDAVRGVVDGAVGGAVRDAVDDAVDDAVGGAVRDAVGGVVGGAKLSWHYWLGGQFWVGGWWYWGSPSIISFFTEVCGLEIAKDIQERAEAYSKVCQSVNYIWPNRDFIMVCERPKKIEKDERGRLSSLTGKAIEYPDGWGLYMINGVRLDEELWKRIVSGKMTAKEVFEIKNTEHRRIAYEQMDKKKMLDLKDFKVLDEVKDDGYGHPMKIISFQVKEFDKPFLYLNCFCPTTGREYFLQTEKEKCVGAKAASFGLEDIKFEQEW